MSRTPAPPPIVVQAFHALTANIGILDENGELIAVNRGWREFAQENGGTTEPLRCNYLEVCAATQGEDRTYAEQVAHGIRRVLRGELQLYELEYPCHSPQQERYFLVKITPFRHEGKAYAVVAHEDITARKHAENNSMNLAHDLINTQQRLEDTNERLTYQLAHDPLTGLLNHTRLETHLQEMLTDAQPAALLFLDLDQFKGVNDSLGHVIGDELLRQVARQLQATVRPGDLIARRGGDEFIVLAPGIRNASEAMQLAQRIQQNLRRPIQLPTELLAITASIGVALTPQDGQEVITLEQHADMAMYAAKEERDHIRLFQPSMTGHHSARHLRMLEIRTALDNDELLLHYQPIFNTRSLQIVKLEALLRWQHPDGILRSASHFIPDVASTTLGTDIGTWVLHQALQQLRVWRTTHPHLRVNVNLTPRHFQQDDLPGTIRAALNDANLTPDALELEMTEEVMTSHPRWDGFHDLLADGLTLAVDDFGIGYSSLSRLVDVPASTVKIDRSLTQGLLLEKGRHPTRKVLQAMIAFARAFDLTLTAEGVETQEQLDTLRGWGCPQVQGYYLSRPLPPELISELLNDNPVQ